MSEALGNAQSQTGGLQKMQKIQKSKKIQKNPKNAPNTTKMMTDNGTPRNISSHTDQQNLFFQTSAFRKGGVCGVRGGAVLSDSKHWLDSSLSQAERPTSREHSNLLNRRLPRFEESRWDGFLQDISSGGP